MHAITRRVGERTALAGRQGRVRCAAFGVRGAEFCRNPQHAIGELAVAHNRQSQGGRATLGRYTGDFALAGAGERREWLVFVPLVRCLATSYHGCRKQIQISFFGPRGRSKEEGRLKGTFLGSTQKKSGFSQGVEAVTVGLRFFGSTQLELLAEIREVVLLGVEADDGPPADFFGARPKKLAPF